MTLERIVALVMTGVLTVCVATLLTIATIDDRLAALAIGLHEARNTEPNLVDELLTRLDELLEQRDRIAAMLPKPRAVAD